MGCDADLQHRLTGWPAHPAQHVVVVVGVEAGRLSLISLLWTIYNVELDLRMTECKLLKC